MVEPKKFDYVAIAQKRCDQGSRACRSDIDMAIELVNGIPKDGQIVKLGANCPVTLVMTALRPDVHHLAIEDGDTFICMEESMLATYQQQDGLDMRRYKAVYPRDGLKEAQVYRGKPIDLLFLHFPCHIQEYTAQMMKDRINAWAKFLGKASWVVVDDWMKDPRVIEAAKVFGREPDKESGWEAAWRFNG